MRRFITLGSVVVLAIALSVCSPENSSVEVSGDCATAYNGQVCTWATIQGSTPVEVGITVPLASIENAPDEEAMVWPPAAAAELDLPEAAYQGGGLTHFTMYWEPHGHPPGPYLVPHFDFHFYLIPPRERLAIDCSDSSKPSTLPSAYSMPDEALPPELVALTGVETLIGICVPEMGMHSLPTAEMESDTPFRGTMVVGYYGGKPIFVEPMITRAMLMERQSFDLSLPEVPGLSGGHPTAFHAEYDADQDAYRFVFSGFAPAT